MIASIDNKTKNVKLVSVYRDTFLSVGGGTYFKCNNAYARGGAKQAVQMLNSNLDLDIKEYVCVDWAAVVEVIDDLGGLDLNITQGEMNQINKYKKDVDGVTGKNTPNVTQYGLVHLDGTQATTYARIENFPEMILNVHPSENCAAGNVGESKESKSGNTCQNL